MRIRPLLACQFFFLFTLAQKPHDIPEFGKVEKGELQAKECDFDKKAPAFEAFDVAEVYCVFFPTAMGLDPVTSELTRHVRIKILNDRGLSSADVRIPFYSFGGEEKVRDILAQTYNLDAGGNIVISKLEKKLIYEKKLNKRYSEEVFTLPDVRPGSVIEYEYTVKSDGFGSLKNWYFQKSIPVKFSRYTINFPPEFEVSANPHCFLPYDKSFDNKKNRMVQTYSMENVPAMADEPFITCKEDYLQHLEPTIVAVNTPTQRVPVLRPWPYHIKSLMEDEDFGLQLKKDIPRTADLDAELEKIKDAYQRMAHIYYYVRKNMTWNGYDNIWALDGVKSAWKDKKGTSGEINLILINLLKNADINAHAVLVSTRDNGRVNTMVPEVAQFNKVMAYVQLDSTVYVLDATDRFCPPNLIPIDVMYSEGLVIEKPLSFEWGWKFLWDSRMVYTNYVSILGEIDDNGQMNGTTQVSSMGYERVTRADKLSKGKDDFIKDHFLSADPSVKIDSFTVQNESADTLPLLQSFNFTRSLASSGEYKYFQLNMFTGFEKNVFVADNRFSDIFFGANQKYIFSGSFILPNSYTIEELPKDIRMIMPDTSIILVRRTLLQGDRLLSSINIEVRRPVFQVEEYAFLSEFYKKLYDILNEQIVLTKKK